MPVKTHKYSNGEVTVVWKPDICIHSAICFRGLHDVFDPQKRPWININGASTERIVEQVKKCPSGALSYIMNEEQPEENKDESTGNFPVSKKLTITTQTIAMAAKSKTNFARRISMSFFSTHAT